MRDYHYYDDDGRRIPISQMTTVDIDRWLRDGFKMVKGSEVTPEAVRERLQLELFIREKGLRDQ